MILSFYRHESTQPLCARQRKSGHISQMSCLNYFLLMGVRNSEV